MFRGGQPDLAFESLRLFMLCAATKWSHLPVSGGWYDQHPQFVDEIVLILQVQNEVEEEKQAAQDPTKVRRDAAREYAAMHDQPPIIR